MEEMVVILACAACNRIATETDIIGKEESDEEVTCICGSHQFAEVQLPESMAQDDYLIVDGAK